MKEVQTRTLLRCYDCGNTFEREVDSRIIGDAASLPAALAAHKAGWLVKDGRIYCPDCAGPHRPHLLM